MQSENEGGRDKAHGGAYVLEVLNPVAKIVQRKVAPAPRSQDLSGKTLGLYWNQKEGGDVALAVAARLLESKYKGLKFQRFTYPFPTKNEALATVVSANVDAIISTSAD